MSVLAIFPAPKTGDGTTVDEFVVVEHVVQGRDACRSGIKSPAHDDMWVFLLVYLCPYGVHEVVGALLGD